ncbi:MAG: crosslink repair DNA glycosylase YcaQ family protein [Acidimicrobiia bacterium]|nr:crosslink repair DNA glycosylase YcaQ family protein [Acidimicrobiia bacterium]
MRQLRLDQARRIAVAAQGFADHRPQGRIDRRHFRRVIDKIGLLQLDSVNVLERSHYLPMWSRLGAYRKDALDEFTARSGEMFEYWGHVASILPVETYPLFRWRMDAITPGPRTQAMLDDHPDYLESVLAEIAEHGPLTVSQLSDPGSRTGPWWGHGKGKVALDWLFSKGLITAYRNGNFGRLYDLPERVIPAEHLNAPALSKEDAYRELLLLSARHHGVGTLGDLADYYRLNKVLTREVMAEIVTSGELVEAEVEGWDQPAILDPAARLPRRVDGATLLTPFDPIVWERDRAERLFEFFYRIEIYVPEPDRVYGYYVLPFLMGDALVGRVDLKSDRRNGVLLVKGSYHEPGADPDEVAAKLGPELRQMSEWLGLGDVDIAANGNLAAALRSVG